MSPEAKAFHHGFINLIFSHIVPSVFKTCGLQFAIDRLAGPFLSLLQFFEVLFSCIKYCLSLLLFTCCWPVWFSSGSLIHPQLHVSSFNGCRASAMLSVCCCILSKLTESDSFLLSSSLSVSVQDTCVLPSSPLPLLVSVAWVPLCCLRIVRLCLLRRDWLQCRVRLRCHWSREFWASTLSWRAASRGWKLVM